jgi:hypothetical protein
MAKPGAADKLLSPQQKARVTAAVAPLMPTLGYPPPSGRIVATGRAVNAVFWPGFMARMLRRRASNRWGDADKRRQASHRRRDAQLQRRLAKQAASRSAKDNGTAG